eukprot:3533578-Prymnesium_polylepis.1
MRRPADANLAGQVGRPELEAGERGDAGRRGRHAVGRAVARRAAWGDARRRHALERGLVGIIGGAIARALVARRGCVAH